MNNTNKKYKKISSLIDKISKNNINFNNEFNKEFKVRILQILSQDIVDNYNQNLNFNKFKITESFKVNLKVTFILKAFFNFFIRCIFFCLICLLSLFKKNKNKKINLIEIDNIENYTISKSIINFLSKNKEIFKSRNYFIINKLGIKKFRSKKYIFLKKNIFIFVISDLLNFKQKLILIKNIAKIFFQNLENVLKPDLNIFLLDDLLKLEIIKISNINHFYTTSNRVRNTPLWMSYNFNKKFKSNMLWLGETALSLPRLFKKNKKYNKHKNILPFYKYINSDNHIVWNMEFKKFLEKNILINKTITNNNKPLILFHLRKFKSKKNSIFVFDNNPKFKGFNGDIENYVSEDVIIKFLNDICYEFSLIEERNFTLVIKKKKAGFNNWYESKKYIDNFNYLKSKYKNIKIIDDYHNTVKYLNSSILCICFPFSSSARLSKYYKIKTLFYDPINKLKNIYYDKKIPLISNRKQINKIFKTL
tara:strand:+ start:611 stop:2041 length:1431 start_codon:yes stop_codon:yes gene_type:complete